MAGDAQIMSRPLYVLGISAFYHDSAACVTKDGEIVSAAQEERFSRKKNDPRFPVHAIASCLGDAGIEPDELAAVCFYDNPALSFDRVMRTFAASGREGLESFVRGIPGWLTGKFFVERLVREELNLPDRIPVLCDEHHFSHAASAFFPSPFEEAAILTCDGVCEWATTTLGIGEGNDLQILKEIRFPHSLGLLYSAMTYFCGFKVNSGEYKLMGLAPYGKPRYADRIREHLIAVKPDGSFRLDLKYFGYTRTMRRLTNDAFHKLFEGPPREPESRITRREMDLAASIQIVTEEVVVKLCRHLRALTGKKNLCLAGGVALNCVANGKVLREKIFDRVWIQPAAGDAGGAIGAALHATHGYFGRPRPKVNPKRDSQKGSYLGPHYTNEEVKAFLDQREYPYRQVSDQERSHIIAKELAEGKIVGWAVGPMEFGPRSLGARSILGDARNEATQSVMNLKIKFRESFRPFAPAVLEERCADYFDIDTDSPYMLVVAPVREELRNPVDAMDTDDMIAIVNQKRSLFPAITHVDFSARIQTVNDAKPDFYDLIKEFEKITGNGVIVNTSFNVRSEPIVCSPQDAYTCFMRTDMNVLVLENCLLYKQEQPHFEDMEDWRQNYELD
jgi:carbamoyltransferase